MHKSWGYYTEAEVDVVVTSLQDMLCSNYIKKVAKGQTVSWDEKRAWDTRMAERALIREHSVSCLCDECR